MDYAEFSFSTTPNLPLSEAVRWVSFLYLKVTEYFDYLYIPFFWNFPWVEWWSADCQYRANVQNNIYCWVFFFAYFFKNNFCFFIFKIHKSDQWFFIVSDSIYKRGYSVLPFKKRTWLTSKLKTCETSTQLLYLQRQFSPVWPLCWTSGMFGQVVVWWNLAILWCAVKTSLGDYFSIAHSPPPPHRDMMRIDPMMAMVLVYLIVTSVFPSLKATGKPRL